MSPVSDPWLEIEPDPDADPAVPGFIELVRFRSQPSGVKGRALIVRLAAPGPHPPLFRAEKRSWALELVTREHDVGIGYSYPDPDRADDLWIYRPSTRRIERLSYESHGRISRIQRLCLALVTGGLAEEIDILQRTRGRVTAGPDLRKAIDPRLRWLGSR